VQQLRPEKCETVKDHIRKCIDGIELISYRKLCAQSLAIARIKSYTRICSVDGPFDLLKNSKAFRTCIIKELMHFLSRVLFLCNANSPAIRQRLRVNKPVFAKFYYKDV